MTRNNSSHECSGSLRHDRCQATNNGRTLDAPFSAPERLLLLGNLTRFLVRHGAQPEQVAAELGFSLKLCELAISFATAADVLRLRALVENWSILKIRAELSSSMH